MSFLTTLTDLLYPRTCPACGRAAGSELSHVCWNCVTDSVSIRSPFCRICGNPVDGIVEHEYCCSWCRVDRPWFDKARSALRYRASIQKAVRVFKYEHGTFLSADLGKFLVACVQAHYSANHFDAVTYVPLHSVQERERTYNQSRLLAKEVARTMNVQILHNCLRRVRRTVSQTGLNAAQRRENVDHAFMVEKADWLDGRRLLLVDDVMTTGATVNECARILRKGGAIEVHVVTLARG